MIAFAIAGVFFRLKGLGKWSFTNDEYYLAQSVRYILATGLPQYPCGGFYTRGLLYQYVMVPFIALGFKPELVFRLVPVVAHIVALPGLYILSKKVTGKIGACLLVSIFSISLVETEISRFARMYLPFQAIFIWYLNFLYKYMVENDPKSFRWMIVLSLLGPFVFEGGIFLVILNFLPLLKEKGLPINRVVLSIFVFLVAYLFLSFDFRHFPAGVKSFWPENLPITLKGGGGRIILPKILAAAMVHKTAWLVPLVAAMAVSAWGVYCIIRDSSLSPLSKLCLSVCVGFSLCNLFGLTVLAMLLMLLLELIKVEEFKKPLARAFFIPVIANFIFFIIFGLFNPGSYGFLELMKHGQVDSLAAAIFNKLPDSVPYAAHLVNLFLALFYYPEGLSGVLYGWVRVYPALVIILSPAILFAVVISIYSNSRELSPFKLIAAIFFLLLLVVGVLNIGNGTRYTFFLYPVFIMLGIKAFNLVAAHIFKSPLKPQLATALLISLIFVSSSDFDLDHLTKIDSAKYTFRKDLDRSMTGHYIMRRDYKGVADFIDNHVKDDEIVISAHQSLDYYTKKVDYILFGHNNNNFRAYTACNGQKDRWTNLDLIYRMDRLFDFIKTSQKDIWIVVNLKTRRYDETEIINTYKDHLVFTAQDGILGVFKIDKAV